MGVLLIVHLGVVLALFVTLPYGKFVHGFYRVGRARCAFERERDRRVAAALESPRMPRLRLALTIAVLLAAADAAPVRAEWNPALAARYLDARQKEWFAWKTAQSADGPCVSCHTGMTYLLARPVLRRVLHEAEPTAFETGLLNRLRTKMAQAGGRRARHRRGRPRRDVLQPRRRPHRDELAREAGVRPAVGAPGSRRARQGRLAVVRANLDPWENPESGYYGAALVALALGQAPEAYRQDPRAGRLPPSLIAFLANPPPPPRLHDRLALLWASTSTPALLCRRRRAAR